MTLPTSSKVLGDVVTRFANNYIDSATYKNNFHKGRALLVALRERAINATGGDKISHRVNLGTSPVGKSYADGEGFDLIKTANRTAVEFDWSFILEPGVLYFQELFKASGSPEKVQSLTESTVDETGELLKQNLVSMLSQTTKASSTDLNTILEFVKTTGEFGGLNPATAGQSAWAATNVDTIDFSAVGPAKMRTGSRTASMGGKYGTDLYLLPGTFHDEAMEIGDAKVAINQDATTRSGKTKNADLGLDNLTINSRPVIWDPTWDANQSATGIGFDFDGIHLVENSTHSLRMEDWVKTYHNGLDAMVTIQRYVGQLTGSRRQSQVSFTTLS